MITQIIVILSIIALSAILTCWVNYQTAIAQPSKEGQQNLLNRTNFDKLYNQTMDRCSNYGNLTLLESIECINLIEDRVEQMASTAAALAASGGGPAAASAGLGTGSSAAEAAGAINSNECKK